MCGIGVVVSALASGDAAAAVKALLRRRGPDSFGEHNVRICNTDDAAGLQLSILAAVLSMREPLFAQPCKIMNNESFVAYNGEVYEIDDACIAGKPDTPEVVRLVEGALCRDGIDHDAIMFDGGSNREMEMLGEDGGDLERLSKALLRLNGPWAIIVWDARHQRLIFARDPLGRRSLLRWHGQPGDSTAFGIASVAPKGAQRCHEFEPSGLYVLDVGALAVAAAVATETGNQDEDPFINLRHLPFPNRIEPQSIDVTMQTAEASPDVLMQSANVLLESLRKAVRLRVQYHCEGAVGVLFSGGVDCTVLAALAHSYLPLSEPIDLFNVCFEAPHHWSPDRMSALASCSELQQAFPERKWNLVCIDHDDSDLVREESHIISVLCPRTTHMDFNIGSALWFASNAKGYIAEEPDFHDIPKHSVKEAESIAELRMKALLGQDEHEKVKGKKQKTHSQTHGESDGNVVQDVLQVSKKDCSLKCAGSRCRGGEHLKASCAHQSCATCCKMHQRADSAAARCGPHKLAKDKDAARKRRRQGELSERAELKGQAETKSEFMDERSDEGLSKESEGCASKRTHPKELCGVPRGDGSNDSVAGATSCKEKHIYCSPARILLSGLGADEQLGGYGRHRVAFTKGSWDSLRAEIEGDIARLWHRNLGRDDRCISDRGKEVRHPFLDENVMKTIASLPFRHVMDPTLREGTGDKRILRMIACKLGLPGASGLAKRAIQFGTRIAQVSRAHAPGSNRSYDPSAEYVLRGSIEGAGIDSSANDVISAAKDLASL